MAFAWTGWIIIFMVLALIMVYHPELIPTGYVKPLAAAMFFSFLMLMALTVAFNAFNKVDKFLEDPPSVTTTTVDWFDNR